MRPANDGEAVAVRAGKTVVVALGGNAILQPGQVGTFEEQLFNIDGAMRRIVELVEDGWRVVLTHGNGPQVGDLLVQNALAAKAVPPMPMDVCGAMSQGEIGYMLEQTLLNHFRKRHLEVPVVTVLTQVAVSPTDPAFENPSKPVGAFYSESEAKQMALEEGHVMREDAGRGWRRVVPSPEPMEIVPREAIVDMVRDGICVICSGGGGVPVVRANDGSLSGIAAVIDKDLAAALLAKEVGAEALLILTDVPQAYVHYNTPEQEALSTVSVKEMEGYAAEGHFKAGSMGPKVAACLRFARAGGDAVIASLTEVVPALQGTAGTRIVGAPGGKAKSGGSRARPAGTKSGGAKGSAKTKPSGKSKSGGKSKAAGGAGARKATGAKKTAGHKDKPSAGAQVIDIGVARRRASGGRS